MGNREQERSKMKLGENIKNCRIAKGMNQTDLAKKCGVSRIAIFFWESGARTPTPHNLKRLSKALGVRIKDLLGKE